MIKNMKKAITLFLLFILIGNFQICLSDRLINQIEKNNKENKQENNKENKQEKNKELIKELLKIIKIKKYDKQKIQIKQKRFK